MKIVQGLTASSAQTTDLVLADGTVAQLALQFRPQQTGWFYDLSYNGANRIFPISGRRVVTSPNMLRTFKNLIPFGLAMTYLNNAEPMFQDDWVNGNATMWLLEAADIAEMEATLFAGR